MCLGTCSFTEIVQRALRSWRVFGTGYTYFVDCRRTKTRCVEAEIDIRYFMACIDSTVVYRKMLNTTMRIHGLMGTFSGYQESICASMFLDFLVQLLK